MAKLTQAQINERIAASVKKRPPHEKIDNSERLTTSGLRIVHFLPEGLALNAVNQQRIRNTNVPPAERVEKEFRARADGLTVAYKPSVRNPAVLEISTALCRKGDVFSRKMGTKLAIENFQAGRTVFVPAMADVGPVGALRDMFDNGY